jgi:O-antigen/teichoic acid export membrane protein
LYGGASALNVAFGLVTFPLLARHFSVADYGLVDLFTVVAGFVAVLFIFGQDSAVARFFYEYDDVDRRRQMASQSLVFQLCVVACLIPILWLAAGAISASLAPAPGAPLLIKLVLLQAPFQVLLNFSQNLLKWTFCRRDFIVLSVGSVVARLALLIIAVLWFDIGVVGVFVITLGVQIAFGLLGLYLVRNWLTRPNDYSCLRDLLPYAIPYGVIGSASAFMPALERSIVSERLGTDNLGLYAAGAKIAMLMSLPIQAFQTAWGPFSLAIHKQANAAATYNWVLKGFAIAICASVLGLALLAEPLIRLFASERYSTAAVVVFPLAFGLAVQATSWITEIGIGISKRTYLTLQAYAVFLGVTALAIYCLAAQMGLFGAALGLMLGQVIKALHSTYLAQRAYRLPWPFARIFLLIAFTLAFGLVGQAISARSDGPGASLTLLLGLGLLPVLAWTLIFTEDERRSIASWVTNRARPSV